MLKNLSSSDSLPWHVIGDSNDIFSHLINVGSSGLRIIKKGD